MHGARNLEYIKTTFRESDILCLCETWAESTSAFAAGFSRELRVFYSPAVRTERRGRASGGLAVVLSKKFYSVKAISINKDFVIIQVNSHMVSFILCAIYIAPDNAIVLFLEDFFFYC